MTQKDKDLLLKDIYARIPYGVKGCFEGETFCTTPSHWYVENTLEFSVNYNVIKNGWRPYLFPLSSMTDEQKNECFKGTPLEIDKYGSIAVKDDLYGGSLYTDLDIYLEVIVWLLKNHFDYRGLIPKGLAIDATGKGIY